VVAVTEDESKALISSFNFAICLLISSALAPETLALDLFKA